MDGLLLQNWVTISLASGLGASTVTQGADRWLQVPTYVDAVFFLDVKQPGSGVSLYYQTAPRREDTSFQTMFTVPLTAGTRVDPVLGKFAPVPLSKYLRWQLNFTTFGGDAASVTFRVLLATYSLG